VAERNTSPNKFESDLDEILEKGRGEVVKTWKFHCSLCGLTRKACYFDSGLIVDLSVDQELDVKNVEWTGDEEQGHYKNLYVVPEAGDEQSWESQEKVAFIKSAVAQLHAELFHGFSKSKILSTS